MDIFDKGTFVKIDHVFLKSGIVALESLGKLQERFKKADTDTVINEIRDTFLAHLLGYDLINTQKHGFDAKNSKTGQFLEVKQCGLQRKSIGGTWNDTSEAKALAFSDERVFTVIGVWDMAIDLKFYVYGQHKDLGLYLHHMVINRKAGSRSTQSIPIIKLVKDFGFKIYPGPGIDKSLVSKLLSLASKSFLKLESEQDIYGKY